MYESLMIATRRIKRKCDNPDDINTQFVIDAINLADRVLELDSYLADGGVLPAPWSDVIGIKGSRRFE
jgi:hypothetical protein